MVSTRFLRHMEWRTACYSIRVLNDEFSFYNLGDQNDSIQLRENRWFVPSWTVRQHEVPGTTSLENRKRTFPILNLLTAILNRYLPHLQLRQDPHIRDEREA